MALELNKDIEWSLTWEARAAIHQLKQKWQLDEDFALTLLERIWPECFIYEFNDAATDPDAGVQGCATSEPYGND